MAYPLVSVLMPRKITRPGLIRKLDGLVSQYVRRRDSYMNCAGHEGYASCVTCGKTAHWQDMQCGHWIKRGHASTRFDLRNVYAQCPGCNMFSGGRQDEMAGHILALHGPETVKELLTLKRTPKRWSVAELHEKIAEFQELLAGLD
jgi:hypothetical protein